MLACCSALRKYENGLEQYMYTLHQVKGNIGNSIQQPIPEMQVAPPSSSATTHWESSAQREGYSVLTQRPQ